MLEIPYETYATANSPQNVRASPLLRRAASQHNAAAVKQHAI